MVETKFICTGSCGGVVTEEQHNEGKTTCGAEDCERHGMPLEKRNHCENCDAYFEEGEEHVCG